MKLKKFINAQPDIFNRIPEAKQWLNDLPEDVYKKEDLKNGGSPLAISSNGKILISRTLKFNLIDIFATSKKGEFTQDRMNTAISFY